MTVYRAAWVCPVDQPPVQGGVVGVDDGRIIAVGRDQAAGEPIIDLGDVVLLPGLVNAHTHLELSWMRGRVPPASRFTDWVKTLFAIRGRPDGGMTNDQIAPIHLAIEELQATGTVAVGDISNSLAAVGPMRHAGLDGVVFHELLGFKERDGALLQATRGLRDAAMQAGATVSLAPHAPYSTSIELFQAIRAAVSDSATPMMSVHLGESPEEVEFVGRGTGPWRSMLETIGLWRDDWEVPGCDPVAYLDRHGVIDANTLVVHGVQLDDAALGRLAEIGATLVTCPRSNQWVGVGYPPIERFYESGVSVAVGTDSLASVEDLNLFSELETMRNLAPRVAARRILESGTLIGARALGLGDELGSLTPGKRAEMIAVRVPEGVTDIEEFLLSGIEASEIQLLNP
ncbi:MAG TPA: amidohydrolase family protein [Vicinamibacterales bacterium]|jgi:cytosine/adenosine deaminase-related metal-dependent hydrolase